MDAWIIGLVAVCVVGLAAILYGALADRRRNRARAAAMLAPPERDIPRFRPEATRPQYLSELMARRPVAVSTAARLDPAEIAAQQQAATTVSVGAGWASKDFVTDSGSKLAVLDAPRVLVCAEAPGSLRELISVLEKVALAGTPLVIMAPALGDGLLETLEVNVLQQRVQVLAVVCPDPHLVDRVAASTGARLVSRIDLQASYITDADLGRCDRWIADRRTSWVVTVATGS